MIENAQQAQNGAYDWEIYRENVRPIRTGRRVGALSQALTHSVSHADQVANQKLEETFKHCEESNDPLAECLKFCTWFDETFPIGRQRLFYQILWKIANKYSKESRYLNDSRMLNIWERLAENSLGHGHEVYQHAVNIGSLVRSAQLYVKWARDYEAHGAMPSARRVLNKGRMEQAEPIEIIEQEEGELEMREVRRQMNADAERSIDSDEEELFDENEHRIAFTRITGLGDEMAVPVVRLPALVGEQGTSRLDRGDGARPQQVKLDSSIEVFEDKHDDDENNYLERLYDMHLDSNIERFILKENNSVPLAPSTNKMKHHIPPSSAFTVWEDNKENIDPNGEKAKEPAKRVNKIMLPKSCWHDFSLEELMAQRYEEQHKDSTPDTVQKRLMFDESDEEND